MDKIIGHEKQKQILKKMIDEDKIGHAYLFTGKDGIGKKLVAIEFAKQVMSSETSDSFNETDFKIILPEKESIKIEEVRNLIDEVYLKPTYSKRKVIIIDDADKMNMNAQNALLKVLEEPPVYATLILITSNKDKIIKTILSRVTEIKFSPLSNEELLEIIGKDVEFDFARGSASKALALINDSTYSLSKELVDVLEKHNFIDVNRKLSEIKSMDDVDMCKLLEFSKIIYYKDLKTDTYKKVKKISLIDETIRNIKRNANLDLTLDNLNIKFKRL